jgi:hypothetical protein
MKLGFIAKHWGIRPVRWICEALGVSRRVLCLAHARVVDSRLAAQGAGSAAVLYHLFAQPAHPGQARVGTRRSRVRPILVPERSFRLLLCW